MDHTTVATPVLTPHTQGDANAPRKQTRPLEPADWDARYAAQELIWTAEPNRRFVQEVQMLAPGRAIDLAAGEGRNAVWLAERGWEVDALDFSKVALEKGRQLAQARGVAQTVHFEQADLRHASLPSAAYDLVALIYLQIPQETLVPILKRSVQALIPGGHWVLIAHDSSNLEHGFGGPKHADMLYTADQVLRALDGSLVIEFAGTIEREVKTDDGIRVAIDCLVHARRPHA